MRKSLILVLLLITSTLGSYASDKPLFVTITSKFCITCKQLEPIVEELKSKYGEKIDFIKLDVSSKDSLEEAKNTASQYGISDYYDQNKMNIPNVGIFCLSANKPEKSFLGETNKKLYEDSLNELIVNSSKVCSK